MLDVPLTSKGESVILILHAADPRGWPRIRNSAEKAKEPQPGHYRRLKPATTTRARFFNENKGSRQLGAVGEDQKRPGGEWWCTGLKKPFGWALRAVALQAKRGRPITKRPDTIAGVT